MTIKGWFHTPQSSKSEGLLLYAVIPRTPLLKVDLTPLQGMSAYSKPCWYCEIKMNYIDNIFLTIMPLLPLWINGLLLLVQIFISMVCKLLFIASKNALPIVLIMWKNSVLQLKTWSIQWCYCIVCICCSFCRNKLKALLSECHLYLYTIFNLGAIYQPLRSGRIWHKVNF